jgi:Domain of unknown function (DUF4291)
MTTRLKLELYNEGRAYMPQYGCQLSGQCDLKEDSVVLYRACCEHLGPHAVENQNFKGVDCYEKDQTRSECAMLSLVLRFIPLHCCNKRHFKQRLRHALTALVTCCCSLCLLPCAVMWFYISFLTAMHRCEWGLKPGHNVPIALWVKRSFFEDCVQAAVSCDNSSTEAALGGYTGPTTSRRSVDLVRVMWEQDRLPSGEKHNRRRVVRVSAGISSTASSASQFE